MSDLSHQERPFRWTDPILCAIFLGTISGLLLVLVVAIGRASGVLVTLGPHLLWMAPVSTVLALLLPSTFGFMVGRALHRPDTIAWVAGPAVFLAGMNLTLFIPGSHLAADFLLTLGLTVLVLRWARKRQDFVVRLVRVSAVPSLVLVGLLCGAAFFLEWRSEKNRMAAVPIGHRTSPNFLLIILDTVRGQSLSLNGYERRTSPNLSRLAQEGVWFRHAVPTASWTLPSHASMFTGYYPHDLSVDWEVPLDDAVATLAEVLSGRGYLTAGFVANPSYTSRTYGLNRGFVHYSDLPVTPSEIATSSKLVRDFLNHGLIRRVTGYYDYMGRRHPDDIFASLTAWVEKNDRRPYFMFVNLFDAHEPYAPPPAWDRAFASPFPRRQDRTIFLLHEGKRIDKKQMSPAELLRERDAYDAAIAYQDSLLGVELDRLASRQLLANTITIITSDHGEEFGEHGKLAHGSSLYHQVLDVPLIFYAPGIIDGGKTVNSVVSLRDLPATIMDLGGVSEHPFPGVSLVTCWQTGAGCQRSPAISELRFGPRQAVSVMTDSLHFIAWPGDSGPKELLYAWRDDPEEEVDLIGTMPVPEAIRSIAERVPGSVLQTSSADAGGHQ